MTIVVCVAVYIDEDFFDELPEMEEEEEDMLDLAWGTPPPHAAAEDHLATRSTGLGCWLVCESRGGLDRCCLLLCLSALLLADLLTAAHEALWAQSFSSPLR